MIPAFTDGRYAARVGGPACWTHFGKILSACEYPFFDFLISICYCC